MSDLSERLAAWVKAVNDLKKAEDQCEWDRGYFLADDYERVERLENDFLDTLAERLKERKAER